MVGVRRMPPGSLVGWLLVAGVLLGVALMHGVSCGTSTMSRDAMPHHAAAAAVVADPADDAASADGPAPAFGMAESHSSHPAMVAGACLVLLATVAGIAVAMLRGRRTLPVDTWRPAREACATPMSAPALTRLCLLRV